MKITFIRHAQSEYNVRHLLSGRTDVPCTQEGLEKAREMAKEIKEKFDYYYCSPLTRAVQTAKALFGDVNIIIDDRIIERDFGDWEGKPLEEIPTDLLDELRVGEYNPPNSETAVDFDNRISEFMEFLKQTHSKNAKIAVVCHGFIVRWIKHKFGLEKSVDMKKSVATTNLEMVTITL